ncbi:helix-turn-helix domain-containing protein [Spirillospora sp. NPDC000708]
MTSPAPLPAAEAPIVLASGRPLGDGDELIRELRKRVPDTARVAVRRIERELPGYVRVHDGRYARVLAFSVEWAVRHFVGLLGDPGPPSAALTGHFRRLGAGEAREGRSLETFQAALRIGAGVAIQRLTEEAESLGAPVTPATVVHVTQAALGYLGRLAAAAAEGHAEAGAQRAGRFRSRRRALLEKLVERDAGLAQIRLLAADCDWPVPRTVAAVALSAPPGGPAPRLVLPADVLVGLHLDDPCLVVPDPDGPGRRRALDAALAGWVAAVGPSVPVGRGARSLLLARRVLALARDGVIEAPSPITAADHIPVAMLDRSPELASLLVDRKLRPLLRSPRVQAREKLAETFLACIENDFSATEVAARMNVHAQTVRYRLRQLEALFGDDLHDPAQRLEFHLALRAWIAPHADDGHMLS